MRKTALAAIILTIFLLFTACSGTMGKTGLVFRNNTGTTIDNVYLSPITEEEWGKALTIYRLKDGTTAHISFSATGGASGDVFDFGAISSEGRCFDVYNLELKDGDTFELGPETLIDGLAATTMIVTHADGTTDTYLGYCYYESELEGLSDF